MVRESGRCFGTQARAQKEAGRGEEHGWDGMGWDGMVMGRRWEGTGGRGRTE